MSRRFAYGRSIFGRGEEVYYCPAEAAKVRPSETVASFYDTCARTMVEGNAYPGLFAESDARMAWTLAIDAYLAHWVRNTPHTALRSDVARDLKQSFLVAHRLGWTLEQQLGIKNS